MSLREIGQALNAAFNGLLDYPFPWLTLYSYAVLAIIAFFVLRWLLRVIATFVEDVNIWRQARKAMKDAENAKRS
jgi:uncharacterized protein HemY